MCFHKLQGNMPRDIDFLAVHLTMQLNSAWYLHVSLVSNGSVNAGSSTDQYWCYTVVLHTWYCEVQAEPAFREPIDKGAAGKTS